MRIQGCRQSRLINRFFGRPREAGQAMIETALTIVVFLTSVMGIMDFGRAAYTYNAMSNLAREASHYAMIEYTSDATSPCYWDNFQQSSCLQAIKSYLTTLNMTPGISASAINVGMTIECSGGDSCSPGIPVNVSLSTRFSPVALALVGVNAFSISASSTSEFVVPPSSTPTATPTTPPGFTPTPLPTPTVVPQGAPSNVTVTSNSGCDNNCEAFTISWTPPSNVAALGHYDIRQTVGGIDTYDDPVPASLGGSAVTSTTEDIGSTTNAVCFDVIAVFTDASTWPATGSWHNGSTSPPTCSG